MAPSFWEADCPARGPVLHHAHWSQCSKEHLSPSHSDDQCCHCGDTVGAYGSRVDMELREAGVAPAEPDTDEDIDEDAPLALAPRTRSCIIDHRSIRDGRLIGDEGAEWPTCHICDQQVEPRMITGRGPEGTEHGPGRGELTPRLKDKLIKMQGFLEWQSQR